MRDLFARYNIDFTNFADDPESTINQMVKVAGDILYQLETHKGSQQQSIKEFKGTVTLAPLSDLQIQIAGTISNLIQANANDPAALVQIQSVFEHASKELDKAIDHALYMQDNADAPTRFNRKQKAADYKDLRNTIKMFCTSFKIKFPEDKLPAKQGNFGNGSATFHDHQYFSYRFGIGVVDDEVDPFPEHSISWLPVGESYTALASILGFACYTPGKFLQLADWIKLLVDCGADFENEDNIDVQHFTVTGTDVYMEKIK